MENDLPTNEIKNEDYGLKQVNDIQGNNDKTKDNPDKLAELNKAIEEAMKKGNYGEIKKIQSEFYKNNSSEKTSEKTAETRKAISDMLYGENPSIVKELIKNGQITEADYVAVASIKLQKDRGFSIKQAELNAKRAYYIMSKS